MTNKIEPVSKAAAAYVMYKITHIESNLYHFLIAHGLDFCCSMENEKASFAAFCRAVADQLDPPPPITYMIKSFKQGETTWVSGVEIHLLMRKCFRAGMHNQERYDNNRTVATTQHLSEEAINLELKKQGLLKVIENGSIKNDD